MELRKCKKCGIEKELNKDNFNWRNDTKKYRTTCIECRSAEHQKYQQEHKVQLQEYNKVYYQGNIIELQEQHKTWYQENKEQYKKYKKQYSKKYQKDKRDNDPNFKLRANVSRSILYALKKHNSSKNGESYLKYLPYTIEELKIHLESQFESWMMWDNWGIYNPKTWNDADQNTWTWQLDHIIPHSEFKYVSMNDIEFLGCWAFANLRPYSAKQNFLDGILKTRHK